MISRSQTLSAALFPVWILISGFLLTLGADAERIRLVAGNISSGTQQSYDPGHGARIFKGIKPDIVMIQEFNYGTNSTAAIRGWVTDTFGADFSYFRETGAQIPNGIISRYPIIASGEWKDPNVSNRDFSWARIDIPGPKDLWAVSVHFLTSSSGNRNNQAVDLVEYIQANVPASDFLVIGGDFNCDSRNETQFTTLGSVVYTGAPHPVDGNNNGNTNRNRNKPYDSVFADNDLLPYQVPVVIGNSTFPNGLVVDTRVYTPLSEISPALSSDSNETYMQHMAIVKDFIVPGEPPVITTTTLTGGTVGTSYSATLAATGGTVPYTWSVPSGNLPTGLTLGSGTGILSGTPTAAGTFTFTARVTDSAASSVGKVFTVTITPALAISTASPLAGGTVGTGYSRTLAATGGTAPYTWSVSAGVVPSGLNLGAGGTLSGTPTASGNFTFTARVADSAGAAATKSFSLSVIPALEIASELPETGAIGTPYSQTLSATGGSGPYSWTVFSGTLPTGLSLNGSGLLEGTPSGNGTFTFTVRVTDSAGDSATQPFTVTIKEPFALYLESNDLPADAGALDSDDDGISNLVEFLLGGDPAVHDPEILPVLSLQEDPAVLTYSFSKLRYSGSAAWKVQSTTDLTNWNDLADGEAGVEISVVPDGDMETISVTLPRTEQPVFLRLFVTVP